MTLQNRANQKDVGCLFPSKRRRVSFSEKKTPDVFLVGMVLAAALGATGTALACPVCFQVEENATTDGVQVAVLVLVGVTTVVLGAFARFIVLFARREGDGNGEGTP